MLVPVFTNQFEKDVKLAKRQGKNLEKFKIIAGALLIGEMLDPLHRDRRLIGNFQGRRECHIESDWLLIYRSRMSELFLSGWALIQTSFKKKSTMRP